MWVCLGLLVMIVMARIAETADTTSAIRKAQVTNGRTLDTSVETLRLIRDCTDPSGECYKRGKRQTADAVSSINNVVILAAACSAGLPPHLSVPERQTRIQSCVTSTAIAQTPMVMGVNHTA